MIPTPDFSQLPVDLFIFGGAGFVLGRLFNVNERLLASVLAIGALANHILFQAAERWINPKLNEAFEINLSPEATYTGTNAVVMLATILAAQQLNVLASNWAGVMVFGTLAIFAGRLRVLSVE